jgi:hypothetical protein
MMPNFRACIFMLGVVFIDFGRGCLHDLCKFNYDFFQKLASKGEKLANVLETVVVLRLRF